MYLLNTNIVSELRKAGKAHRGVRKWAQALPAASLYLSEISILELEIGILLIERRDPKQGSIRGWPCFANICGRILAIDTVVAQHCAALHIPDPGSDRDALIAVTELVHGMTVVTRNVNQFQTMGVALVNPWQY